MTLTERIQLVSLGTTIWVIVYRKAARGLAIGEIEWPDRATASAIATAVLVVIPFVLIGIYVALYWIAFGTTP